MALASGEISLQVAVIKRDFSLAGQMLSPRRWRLDATYVEIMLYLYLDLNLDIIPKFIPEIYVEDTIRHFDSLDHSMVDNEDQSLFCDGPGNEEVI